MHRGSHTGRRGRREEVAPAAAMEEGYVKRLLRARSEEEEERRAEEEEARGKVVEEQGESWVRRKRASFESMWVGQSYQDYKVYQVQGRTSPPSLVKQESTTVAVKEENKEKNVNVSCLAKEIRKEIIVEEYVREEEQQESVNRVAAEVFTSVTHVEETGKEEVDSVEAGESVSQHEIGSEVAGVGCSHRRHTNYQSDKREKAREEEIEEITTIKDQDCISDKRDEDEMTTRGDVEGAVAGNRTDVKKPDDISGHQDGEEERSPSPKVARGAGEVVTRQQAIR